MKKIRKRLTYANVMSSIAVFMMLGGAAIAASQLPKNSVGTKQLKKNAVTTPKIKGQAVNAGKIANGAVLTDKIANGAVLTDKIANGAVLTDKIADSAVTTGKVANDAVTGEKANESTFGQVPSAANAESVGGHSASCPANTTLIRGICFDSTSNPVETTVFQASDSCRGKGGYLPTPMELRSTRDVLDLGSGVGTDRQYTDSIYFDDADASPKTLAISDGGGFDPIGTTADAEFICAYQLVR